MIDQETFEGVLRHIKTQEEKGLVTFGPLGEIARSLAICKEALDWYATNAQGINSSIAEEALERAFGKGSR